MVKVRSQGPAVTFSFSSDDTGAAHDNLISFNEVSDNPFVGANVFITPWLPMPATTQKYF